ncbi:hypothetical protein CBM2589_B230142 [Cupriavidus taiwanensis]|uniref:Uncharacterized protein n=1 Tax=Cupriavidus taiwanensis TaxID=164546 RepID=A0A975X075_9BURK|nr:hypothetical protein CBM2589_B230142 [Cupriavidus taiwanensis]
MRRADVFVTSPGGSEFVRMSPDVIRLWQRRPGAYDR